MYVCVCHAVTEDDVRRHSAAGICSAKEIRQACGMRPGCGQCVLKICALLGAAEGTTSGTAEGTTSGTAEGTTSGAAEGTTGSAAEGMGVADATADRTAEGAGPGIRTGAGIRAGAGISTGPGTSTTTTRADVGAAEVCAA